MELESPFNDYSLQEVCFLLRFVYRPSDLTDSNLESVEQHLPGITRLANRRGRGFPAGGFPAHVMQLRLVRKSAPYVSGWAASLGWVLQRHARLSCLHRRSSACWVLAASMPQCTWQPSTSYWQ